MVYTLWCAIIGPGAKAFPVEIDEARTVGQLKEEIVKKARQPLKGIEAYDLELLKVNIDISDDHLYKPATDQISRGAVTSTELLFNPSYQLSAKFGKSDPAKQHIHILVQLPPGQSTDLIDPSVCGAVAETILTRPYGSTVLTQTIDLSYLPGPPVHLVDFPPESE